MIPTLKFRVDSMKAQLRRCWTFIGLFFLLGHGGLASHFKGGQISWARTALDPGAQTATVEFAIVLAMDRSEFPVGSGTAPDGRPAIGDEVQDPIDSAELFFGDGSSEVICNVTDTGATPLRVIDVDFARNHVLLKPVTAPVKTYEYSTLADRWTSELHCRSRDTHLLNLPYTDARLPSIVSVQTARSPQFSASNPHSFIFDRTSPDEVATFSFHLEADPSSPNRSYRLPDHSEMTAPGTTCVFGTLEFCYIDPFSVTQVTLNWHLGGFSTFNRRFPPYGPAVPLECTSAVAQVVAEDTVNGVVQASACIEFQVSVNEKVVHYNTAPAARWAVSPPAGGRTVLLQGRPAVLPFEGVDTDPEAVLRPSLPGPLDPGYIEGAFLSIVHGCSELSGAVLWTPAITQLGNTDVPVTVTDDDGNVQNLLLPVEVAPYDGSHTLTATVISGLSAVTDDGTDPFDPTIRVFSLSGRRGDTVGFKVDVTGGNGLISVRSTSEVKIRRNYEAGNAPFQPEFTWTIPPNGAPATVDLTVQDQTAPAQTLKFRVNMNVTPNETTLLSVTPRHRLIPAGGLLHLDAWSNVILDASFALPDGIEGHLELVGPPGMELELASPATAQPAVHWRPLGNQLGAYSAWLRVVSDTNTVLAEQEMQLLVHSIRPGWWTSNQSEYGIIVAGASARDFAPITLGQLLHVATQFEKYVHFHTGDSVTVPTTSTSHFRMVTIGELKSVAKPFYDALVESSDSEEGFFLHRTGNSLGPIPYPWTDEVSDDSDFSPATLGQLKAVFSCAFGHWRWHECSD